MSEEASNIIDGMFQSRRQAQTQTVTSLDDNPDDAQRAIELGEATNTPPTVVAGDLEGFEKQHKARLASSIVNSNPHIVDYVQSHPLAAKVSNDDWGQLDSVSEKLTGLGAKSVFEHAAEKFKEGWGEGRMGGWLLDNPESQDFIRRAPYSTAAWLALGGLLEVPARGLGAVAMGLGGGVSEAWKQATGSETKIPDEIAHAVLDPGTLATLQGLGPPGWISTPLLSALQKARGLFITSRPWLEQGKAPPHGIDPLIDEAHKEQSKIDLKKYDEALSEAQKSTTRERNPDMFEGFARQHVGDKTIGISGHAVEKLYGDKVPSPDDGLLGHMIPNLAEQLAEAKETGGDVRVPLATWLAKADPEIAKELHDNLRVREGGFTVEEAKEFDPEYPKAPIEDVAPPSAARTTLQIEGVPEEVGEAKPKSDAVRADLEAKLAELKKGLEEKKFLEGYTAYDYAAGIQRVQRKLEGLEQDNVQRAVDTVRHSAGLDEFAKYRDRPATVIPTSAKEGGKPLENRGVAVSPTHTFTVSEGLDSIKRDHLSTLSRTLYDFMSPVFKHWVGEVPISILKREDLNKMILSYPGAKLPEGGSGGAFFPNLRSIGLPEDTASRPRWFSEVVMHETSHAFTLEALARNPMLKAKVERLRNIVQKVVDSRRDALGDAFDYQLSDVDEFMAGAHSNPEFQKLLTSLAIPEALAHELGLGKGPMSAWDVLRRIIRDLWKNAWEKAMGKKYPGRFPDTMMDAALHISKEIEAWNKRWLDESVKERMAFEGPKMAEDRPFKEGMAAGMTKPQYEKYLELIQKRNAEDIEAAIKRAQRDQRRQQTPEYKKQALEERKQAAEDIRSRPDVAADRFLRDAKIKIDPKSLTPEQRKMMPPEYLSKDGVPADDIAGAFGYHNGDAMVNQLLSYNHEMDSLGMRPEEFERKLIQDETDRRMQRHGDLEQNILSEAIDQALSETQQDILHEQTLAAATLAGQKFPIDKKGYIEGLKELFSRATKGDVSTEKYLQQAGRAHRQADIESKAGNEVEAFRQTQQGYNNTVFAREAAKFEKEMARLEKTFDRFKKRGGPGPDGKPSVEPEYTHQIQDIMMRVGRRVNRSVQDLQRAMENDEAKTFAEFVNKKSMGHGQVQLEDGWVPLGGKEIPAPDFLLQEGFHKNLEELSVEDARELKRTVDTLNKIGREEMKVQRENETVDRAELLKEMKEKLKTFPLKVEPLNKGRMWKLKNVAKSYLISLIRAETVWNRWDRNDPNGVFNRFLSYPAAEAANGAARLEREVAKAYEKLGKIKDEDKKLNTPLINTQTGRPFEDFTRKNLQTVISNMGNASNWEKFAKGYRMDPEVLRQWVHSVATKEDFDRAQALGNIFKDLFEKAEVVYRNLYGEPPPRVEIEPIQTPHGTYDGWYHPVIYDPLRGHPTKAMMGEAEPGKNQFRRANTLNGYTKQRTNYFDVMDLSYDRVPARLSQMIHDISFRQFLNEASKIVFDKGFQKMVKDHYGELYASEQTALLKDVAGSPTINSQAMAVGARFSEYLRKNVIASYVGFNPYTAFKHGPTALILSAKEVGYPSLLREYQTLFGKSPEVGNTNWAFAMKHSEELQRRERHFQDSVGGVHGEIYGGGNTMREQVLEKGAWLVSKSDLFSAVPCWLAKYNDLRADGMEHVYAVEQANAAVRNAHGSTAVTSQPSIVRGGGPIHGWITSLYGFFGTMMQRRIEIAYKLSDMYHLGKEGELMEAAKQLPALTNQIWAYVIFPTLVEEYVTSVGTEDHRGWGQRLLSGAIGGVANSFVYFRDIIHGMRTGQTPDVGLISGIFASHEKLFKDLEKGRDAFSKQNAGKTIGDAIAVFGMWSGMSPKIIGNAMKFGINVGVGVEHPKSFNDWWLGLTKGTTKRRMEK